MKERIKFILEWEELWNELEGVVNVSELCRKYGISRETGYYWLRRYQSADHDLAAVQERSRRPLNSPTTIPEEMQDLVVAARKAHPRWGPRKLRAWLVERQPHIPWPSASTGGHWGSGRSVRDLFARTTCRSAAGARFSAPAARGSR